MTQVGRQALVAVGLVAAVMVGGGALAVATHEGRGPAMQALQGISEDGRTLVFSANACRADTRATVMSEDDQRVVVSVTADLSSGDSLGCADGVSVQLREALGDRQVIDAATDEPAARGEACCRPSASG